MNKIFVATAIIASSVVGATAYGQTNWASKPVQCLASADFIEGARANGYQPLVGGLAVSTMEDLTSTFEVAVVYWLLPDTDNWIISETDQEGTTCVLANGNNNNFDTDQINSILDKIADK